MRRRDHSVLDILSWALGNRSGEVVKSIIFGIRQIRKKLLNFFASWFRLQNRGCEPFFLVLLQA